jgi:very-short-patch-repair endonuclease
VRPTGYRNFSEPETDLRMEFQRLIAGLTADESRNHKICADVISSVREGRFPLVLTERTGHLQILTEILSRDVANVISLQGGMSRNELRNALAGLESSESIADRVIVATGRFVGEGFDVPGLDTLFLTLPVSWRGTIAQYAGRLHRLHEGKREVRIFDYADLDIPMLSRMFDKRCQGYEAIGYTILLPASAMPGWPPEVPLPVSPEWKHDYAASVRRLIMDGVDISLAGLFVHATTPPAPEATGEARARSASEAFLYRRLESLPETKGCFQLNADLPIPFNNLGKMEVDFLNPNERIIIELDGAQHLNDPEAYRRDRRRDELLQRNGFYVLRFLTEDVGKHLSKVLDTILAAIVHRRELGKS